MNPVLTAVPTRAIPKAWLESSETSDTTALQVESKPRYHIKWNPLNRPPLGPVKVSLLEGWPRFRGEFVLKSMLWDFSKWPEYKGGHISGVLIRGLPL